MLGRNLYEQQAYNKRLTIVVMVVFVLFLCFIGLGFDFSLGGIREGLFLPFGTIVALVVGTASSVWSLNGGASAVLSSLGAIPPDPANPDHRQLNNIIEEMAIASGLPKPEVRIIPDDDPNALATGASPEKSVIL